jgi:hypothetical protein
VDQSLITKNQIKTQIVDEIIRLVIQPITGIIIGVLLASLIAVGWAYYKRSSNKFRNGRFGKEVTLGFIIVAAATAFFIPTLSLLTV